MGTISKVVLGSYSRTARFALRSATRPWREQRHPEIPTKRPMLPLFAAVFLDELALSAFPRPKIDYSHGELARARAIVFFWSGAGWTDPDGLMHAYFCLEYAAPRNVGESGRLWCVDALNVNGRWWDEVEVTTHWSGWSAGWRP